MFDLQNFLYQAVQSGASDLHLEEGAQPAVRINGEVNFLDMPELSPDDIDMILNTLIDEYSYDEYAKYGDADLSYQIPGVCRFRVNVLNHYSGRGAVMRIIPNDIPTIDDLGLPESLKSIADAQKGLVLVTGPTGSGKTTTLASIINHINTTRAAHIITIEDPIEFIHEPKKSYIEQRQVGTHVPTFSQALTAALRESPDVIMVGEMRDLNTIRQALRAAETGHLVLGTLHTNSVAQTTSRLVDVFPPTEQGSVRALIATVLQACVCQQLMPARGGGRVAAMEILINNHSITSVLREGRFNQLHTFMMMGRKEGMQTFDYHLRELVRNQRVDFDTAAEYASDIENLMSKDGDY